MANTAYPFFAKHLTESPAVDSRRVSATRIVLYDTCQTEGPTLASIPVIIPKVEIISRTGDVSKRDTELDHRVLSEQS